MCIECLRSTIKNRWIPIYNGKPSITCACCVAHPVCLGCFIHEKTKQNKCNDTPYTLWSLLNKKWQLAYKYNKPEAFEIMLDAKTAAGMELEFLQNLLKSKTSCR